MGSNGISCGCTPGAGDDVIIYSRTVTVTAANASASSITMSNVFSSNDFDLIIENGYTLTVSGNISVVANSNNDDVTFDLHDDNSKLIVGGNLSVSMTNGENVFFEMTDNSSLQIGGNLNITMGGTTSSNVEFNLACTSGSNNLQVGGNLYIYKNGARDIIFDLTQQTTIAVFGNFLIDWDDTQSNGDQILMNMEDDAQIIVNGSTDINMNETGNTSCDFILDMNDNASFEVGQDDGLLSNSFTVTIQNGRNTEIYLDYNANLIVYGNASLLHNGTGNLLFYINTSQAGTTGCQMEIDGNLTISKTNGEKAEYFIYEDADVIVGGNFSYSSSYHLSSGKDIRLELMDNAVLDVNGSMTMQLNSQGDVGNDLELILDNTADLIVGIDSGDLSESCQISVSTGTICTIEIDRDATMTIYGDLSVSQAGVNDLFIRLDKNANGSSTDAQLHVYGDASITKSSGNEFKLDVNQDSDMTVDGSMTVSITGFTSTGENIEIELDNNAGLYILGDLQYTMNAGGNTTSDLMLDLNNTSTMEVGTSFNPTAASFQIDFATGDQGIFSISDDCTLSIYGDLTINKSGGGNFDFDSNDDVTVHIYNNLTINNSENADLMTFGLNNNAVVDIDGDIDISSTIAATRVQIDLNSNSYMYLAGDLLRASSPNQFGTFVCNGSSTLELDGSASQVIAEDNGAGSDYVYYLNVVINNTSSSAPQLTLEGEITIHKSLDFQDGIIQNSSSDLIIVIDNATVSNASHDSHVYGTVEKRGNDDFTFPIGSLNYYRPVGISIASGASSSDELSATYYDSDPDGIHSDTLITNTIDHISSCEYWDLELLNGSPTLYVTLSYDDYDTINECSGVDDPTQLVVSHWNGALWDNLGNGSTTGSTTVGTITASTSTNSFSPFTLASTAEGNPLPVELIFFSAQLDEENNVILNWKTASEINNAYFKIEKSYDGISWQELSIMAGQGTKLSPTVYRSQDSQPGLGLIYYRLIQVDLNGTTTLFPPESVKIAGGSALALLIYPNPAKDKLTIFANTENLENIQLHDLSGKTLTSIIDIQMTGFGKYEANLSNLPAGTYLLTILGETRLIRVLP